MSILGGLFRAALGRRHALADRPFILGAPNPHYAPLFLAKEAKPTPADKALARANAEAARERREAEVAKHWREVRAKLRGKYLNSHARRMRAQIMAIG